MNTVNLSGWGVSFIIDILLFPAAEKKVSSQKEVNPMHPQLWYLKDFDLESTQNIKGKKSYIFHSDVYIVRYIT